MRSRKICHIITSLGAGGAEGTLVKLVMNENYHEHIIITLTGKGKYFEKLIKNNYKVYDLNFKNKFFVLLNFLKLVLLIKKINPDAVQTWLYHADLLGGLAAKICFVKNIIWNIRTSYLPSNYKLTTILTIKLCACLSWFIPKKIITCAKSTLSIHEDLGYCVEKFEVIFNGFILPKDEIMNKKLFFENLDLSDKDFNIIFVGRFAPQKDHNNFLRAIELFRRNYPVFLNLNLNIIFIGKDTSEILKNNKWFDANSLNLKLITINNTNNIYKYFSHMDLSVLSSSYGEAFPNVLAESMLCGVPCIATDVGDSKAILGNNGWIVRPSSPKELSEALFEAINTIHLKPKNKKRIAENCKSKVLSEYTLETMVNRYKDLYSNVI